MSVTGKYKLTFRAGMQHVLGMAVYFKRRRFFSHQPGFNPHSLSFMGEVNVRNNAIPTWMTAQALIGLHIRLSCKCGGEQI